MASGLTLDSGAFIAAEKGTARFRALWKEAVERSAVVTVPADVISQVWRVNSPAIARIPNGARSRSWMRPARIGSVPCWPRASPLKWSTPPSFSALLTTATLSSRPIPRTSNDWSLLTASGFHC